MIDILYKIIIPNIKIIRNYKKMIDILHLINYTKNNNTQTTQKEKDGK